MKVGIDVRMSWEVAWHLFSGFVFAPYVMWQLWFGTHDWVLDFFLTILVMGWALDQIKSVAEWRTSYWQDRRDGMSL